MTNRLHEVSPQLSVCHDSAKVSIIPGVSRSVYTFLVNTKILVSKPAKRSVVLYSDDGGEGNFSKFKACAQRCGSSYTLISQHFVVTH